LFSGDRYLFFLVSGFDDDRKVVLFTFCARAFTNRVSLLESKTSLSNLSLFISLSLSAQKCLFVSDDDKEDDVTKKWRTTQKDGKVASENFNQKRINKKKAKNTRQKKRFLSI